MHLPRRQLIFTKLSILCLLFVVAFFNSLAKAEALQKQSPTTATMARDIYEKVRVVFQKLVPRKCCIYHSFSVFTYRCTFLLISVTFRCHSWRGGRNSNWTWSSTAYSWWYYTGDTGKYSLCKEFLSEMRSRLKT